jgi:hypothetical protein
MAMLDRKQLTALTSPLRRQLVLSVYIDGTSSGPAQRHQWRTALDHQLKRVRELAASGSHQERMALERAIGLLDEQLAPFTGEVGAPGWVAFIGPREVHYAGLSPVRMPTLVAWDQGAHIAPFSRALAATRRAVVALVDARKADLFVWHDGHLDRIDSLHAHHAMDEPMHMGSVPRSGFHTGTRGGTGHDKVQRALNEGSARMRREVVARVLELAGADAYVLVGGTPQHRHEVATLLAESARDRLAELESLDIHATAASLTAAAREACEGLRMRELRGQVDSLIESAGGRGAAALGPETTRWALEQARVQTLYLTPRFVEEHADAAETAMRAALDQNATIEEVDDEAAARLDAHGGVAARLRYRLV